MKIIMIIIMTELIEMPDTHAPKLSVKTLMYVPPLSFLF